MKSEKTEILVIGAGAWGTAIANLIAENSHNVFLSANNSKIVSEINTKNTNQKFLPNVVLSKNIKAVEGLGKLLKEVKIIFIATPSSTTNEVLSEIKKAKISDSTSFVICSKGFDHKALEFFSKIFQKDFPKNKFAILSGPNFAIEVAQKSPTITNIASKDKSFAKKIIKILSNEYFKASYFEDCLAVEICGLLKNIAAIGCGIIDELNLGENTKAALVSRAIEEILLLCTKFKASRNINIAAGFGDIFLTCSTTKSRNNFLGHQIAQGKNYKQIVKESGKTFEGAIAADSISRLAKKLKIKLNLCSAINEILVEKKSKKEISDLIKKAIL